jgi:hypothetical protein
VTPSENTKAKTKWQTEVYYLDSCNCDWGCPCQFNAKPTHGNCEGVGVGLAYGLKETFPAMIRGSTQIQPALKKGQRVTIGGATKGTVQEAGSFSIILKDDQGKTIVIPTKNILDKEIVIESGPAPATQEKAVEENRGAGAAGS